MNDTLYGFFIQETINPYGLNDILAELHAAGIVLVDGNSRDEDWPTFQQQLDNICRYNHLYHFQELFRSIIFTEEWKLSHEINV